MNIGIFKKMKESDNNIRKCIVTGASMDKNLMLRFAITPDGVVVPDFKKKLASKGVWVSGSKNILQQAVTKNLFTKANKKPVKVDKSLADIVEGLLKKKGLELISLAKKAGSLIVGLEKIKEASNKDMIEFFLEAKDAGNDGHNRILLMAKQKKVFCLYEIEELDKALNTINTVHLAFIKNQMSKALFEQFLKLENFLTEETEK